MTCNVLGTVNRNPLESHAEPENVWKMLEFHSTKTIGILCSKLKR